MFSLSLLGKYDLQATTKNKSPIVDTNNCLNRIFTSFNALDMEFSLGHRIIDQFSSHFSFHHTSHRDKKTKLLTFKNLTMLSLKHQQILTLSSITHIHLYSNTIKKMLYHAVNITTTKAELFTIRYRINQAIQITDTSYIIIITSSIHSAY